MHEKAVWAATTRTQGFKAHTAAWALFQVHMDSAVGNAKSQNKARRGAGDATWEDIDDWSDLFRLVSMMIRLLACAIEATTTAVFRRAAS